MCSIGGCGKKCHKASRCSRISRYSVNTAKWSCSDHCQNSIVTVAGRPADDLQSSSCSSVPAAGTIERSSCNHCKKTIAKRGTPPLCCQVCKATFHNRCSGLSRDSVQSVIGTNLWTCPVCTTKQQQLLTQSSSQAAAQPRDCGEPKHSTAAKCSLRILQWNADGIKPKLHELEMRMKELDIDVAIIQETKLKKADRSPTLPGYASIRCDRPGESTGGGLLSFIRHSLIFREDSRRTTTADAVTPEVSSFYVKVARHRWLNIVNCYLPPTRTGANVASPTPITSLDFFPATEDTFIGGDLNAHSNLWDSEQPTDSRGDLVTDWILENDMVCVNDGSATRTNRATGGSSSPDITLVHSNWSSKVEWSVGEDLGSDHLPIVVHVKLKITATRQQVNSRPRWRRNGVDWEPFRASVEEAVLELDESEPLVNRISQFNSILIKAAKEHVGKCKRGPRSNEWITPEVKAAIKKRNRLRRQGSSKREEWVEACREAHRLAAEAKEQSWIDFVEDLEHHADPTKVWRIIKSLSGTPGSNAPNEAMILDGRTVSSDDGKANAFMSHYAAVSRLTFSKEERVRNRECKAMLKSSSADSEAGRDFTIIELDSAIAKMTRNLLDCDQSNVLLAHLLHTDRRQDLADNISRDIANFDPNFVFMATGVGCGRIWLTSLNSPIPKTPC